MTSPRQKLLALTLSGIVLFQFVTFIGLVPATAAGNTISGGTASISAAGNAPGVAMPDATIDDSSPSNVTVAFNATGVNSPSLQITGPNFTNIHQSVPSAAGTYEFSIPANTYGGGEQQFTVRLLNGSHQRVAIDTGVVTASSPVTLDNYSVSNTTPSTADTVTVSVNLTNTDTAPQPYTLTLWGGAWPDAPAKFERKNRTVVVDPTSTQRFDIDLSFASSGLKNITVNEEPGTLVDVSQGPTGYVNGSVTNQDGAAVTGVTVWMADPSSGNLVGSDVTDSNGNYSAEVATGTYEVMVFDQNYDFEIQTGVQVTENNTTRVDLQLLEFPESGTLEGTVTDSQGNPLQATVAAGDQSYRFFNQTTSDAATGNYSLSLPAANYTVFVQHPSKPTVVKRNIRITENGTTTLDIVMPEPAYVNGTVTNADGSPAANVQVVADNGDDFGFATTDSNGDYNFSVPPGNYTVSVFAIGGNANSTTVSTQAGATSTADFTLRKSEVRHQSVEVTSGAGGVATGQLGVRAAVQAGMLQIQLVNESSFSGSNPGMPSELQTLGVDDSTEFRINVTVTNFTASSLLWGLDDAAWDTSPNGTVPNATDITITGTAVQLQGVNSQGVGPLLFQDPATVTWPSGRNDRADLGWNQTVYIGVFDLGKMPGEIQTNLAGMSVTTNAQQFSAPSLVNGSLQVWVAGPSKTTDGRDHTGFYQATIPQAQLDAWNVTDPETELTALYKGSTANFTVTNTSDGARIRLENISYSAGFVEVQPKTGGDGGGDTQAGTGDSGTGVGSTGGSGGTGGSSESESDESTATPTPTATPAPTATASPVPTASPSPSPTASPTAADTETSGPSPTATVEPSPTAAGSPTVTETTGQPGFGILVAVLAILAGTGLASRRRNGP